MEKAKRKAVTMADIAESLGVSKNAVSLALANKPGVSPRMREKITDAAQRLNYRLPADKAGRQSCIVVVVPEYIRDDGSFYSDIFWAIEHETRKLGYMTLTAGLSQEAERNLAIPSAPEGLEVLGYLAIGIIRTEYLFRLSAQGKQVVCVDIHNSAVPLSSVGSDNIYGGLLATEHLIENGHQRIGFAGPVFSATSVFERWCGYLQAMMRRGLRADPALSILGRREGFELLDSAATLGGYLSRLSAMPTAWFCAGDMIAVSMTQLLAARGLAVPADVSVVGFDDLKIAEMISPPLSTIHVDRKLMGKEAVHQLLSQARAPLSKTHIHITLPCSLVQRGSVRAVRAADSRGRP